MADAPGAMSAPTPVRARLDGVPRRLPKGTSDRIALTGGKCTCDRSKGTIVLFYAYVPIEDPSALVARLRDVCGTHGVTGKLRIGREGINGTAAGSHAGIEAMRAELASESSHEPSLAAAAGGMDYKPAPGCTCLFDDLSVRLVPEIVPFEPSAGAGGGGGGRKAKAAKKKKGRHAVLGGDDDNEDTRTEHRVPPPCPVSYMDPKEFHDAVVCKDNDTIVLDVRNWYESRVGHFEGAVLAPIRRFSQLPEYVRRNKSVFHGKDVLMYCTGGIRCEKAAKYLASFGEVGEEGDRDGGNQTTKNQFTKSSEAVTGRPRSVRQLRGGIVAYARDVLGSAGDVDEVGADQGADQGAELKSSTTVKSAYLGKNFVFDNRGATRVSGDVVSWCDGCGVRSDRLGKCESVGCHVILIVCEKCGGGKGGGGGGEVFCCGKCESQEVARVATPDGKRKRMPCDCDGYEARERRLLPTPTPR